MLPLATSGVAVGNIRGCHWQHQGLPLATSDVANGNWNKRKLTSRNQTRRIEQNESNNKGLCPSAVVVILCNYALLSASKATAPIK